jgi:hypothetical protein
LSLLQLIAEVAEAFTQERITASHAHLIARLPQESQAEAFEQCWRKDWQDSEPHLLPAKHVSAWIQNNLYLALADAPFDREDPTLNPAAGACVTCPRRSGYNTSLFSDVTDGDQCKLCGIRATASIFRWLATPRPPHQAGPSPRLFSLDLHQEVLLSVDFVVHPVRWERCPLVAADLHACSWLTLQSRRGLAPNTLDAYSRALERYLGMGEVTSRR